MNADSEEYRELQEAFKIEADDHLQGLSSNLLALESALESTPGEAPMPLIESIFREAHSLKGAARAVNMMEVESVCQSLENVFSAWKRRKLQPERAQFDALLEALDVLGQLLAHPNGEGVAIAKVVRQLSDLKFNAAAGQADTTSEQPQNETALPSSSGASSGENQQDIANNGNSNGVAHPIMQSPIERPSTPLGAPARGIESVGRTVEKSVEKSAMPETVRIATGKLDALLLQAEEMLAVKLKAGRQTLELREAEAVFHGWKKEWNKIAPEVRRARAAQEKLRSKVALNGSAAGMLLERDGGSVSTPPAIDQSPRLLDFLDWSHEYLETLGNHLSSLRSTAEADGRELGGMVDNLLDDTKKLLMLPFATLLTNFPKLVRDLARDQEKDVQLLLYGGEVEIDKRILEEMKDPLIHLLRNAVDHGIEEPQIRARQGKLQRATIKLLVSQSSAGEVEILISDDGAGIHDEQVKAAAVRHGLIAQEDAARLDHEQALALIFQSDLSTSPIITEISGRGLGLAIVREKVEKLGGRIAVETQPGAGTTFRIKLPLTLATFRGILVQASGQVLVIPTASVERVVGFRKGEIRTMENRQAIALSRAGGGEDLVSLVHLHEVLELPTLPRGEQRSDDEFLSVIVLGTGEKRIAFAAAEVLSEQEVLVKQLGYPLARVRNVAGATVLGSGQAVTILNVADLLQSASQTQSAQSSAGTGGSTADEDETATKAILVAEDSITSRMLLKNILESAGYQVTTAVDGAAAWASLREKKFDLVVSDVDMPRLSGFDLTAKIRADRLLAELPVVLVTGRGEREDKERGIDVGANAYIVKSSFDQSNLIEVVRRLL
jgi:two-component system chemotaxis sensor kinase CheA